VVANIKQNIECRVGCRGTLYFGNHSTKCFGKFKRDLYNK